MLRRSSSLLIAGSLAVAAGCSADRATAVATPDISPLGGTQVASSGFVT